MRGKPKKSILGKLAVGGLGSVALLAGAVGFLGYTQAGTGVVVNIAEPFLSTPDRKISITGLAPLLTGHLAAEKITIADAKGVYAEVDNLAADWSPVSLLSLRFDASSIKAARVRFERTPEKIQSSSSRSSSLPVEVDIKSISLPDIEIGPQLSGKEEKLSLDGSAAVTRKAVKAALGIQDLGNMSASANFTLDYNIEAKTLAVDAEASEPQDGLVAGLLQLPGRPALGFKIKGDGPLRNWQGALSATLEGTPVVDLDARLQQAAGRPVQVTLKGGGAVDAILPPDIAPLFKGHTALDLAADVDLDAGILAINTGRLQSEAFRAELSGTLSQAGKNNFKALVTPSEANTEFALKAGGRDIKMRLGTLQLSVSGPAEKTQIAANLDFPRLSTRDGELQNIEVKAQSAAFNLKERSGQVSLAASIAGGRFADANLGRLLRLPLTFSAPLTISQKMISGSYELKSAAMDAKGDLEYTIADAALKTTFDVQAAPSVLTPSLQTKVTKPIELGGTLETQNGDFSLSDFNLASQLASAKGSASVTKGKLEASLSGDLPDLAKLQPSATGKGTFSLSASGTTKVPNANLVLDIPEARLSGKDLQHFKFAADGTYSDGTISGDLKAGGVIAKQQIDLSAVLKQAGQFTDIPNIKVVIGSNHITGALKLNQAFLPQGKLNFDLSDLSLLGAMAAQPLSGGLKGDVQLKPVGTAIAAQVRLNGAKVGYSAMRIAGVNVALDYDGEKLVGAVKASDVALGANHFQKASLSFSNSGPNTDFALSGQYEGKPVVAKGTVFPGDGKTVVQAKVVSATIKGVALKLKAPTDISIANQGISIENLQIAAGKGTVAVSGIAGDKLALQAKVEALPASLANSFSPGLGADGAISGTVDVSGSSSNPVVKFSLAWPRASLAATRSAGAPALNINAKGQYSGSRLRLDANASGGGLSVKGGGSLALTGAQAIDMRFSGSAPLSLAQAVLSSQGISVGGTAGFNLSLGGNLKALAYRGDIKLASARATLPRQNLNLTGINGSVVLDGKIAKLVGVSGKFSGGGRFDVSGQMGIAPGSGYPADIAVKLVNVSYTDGNIVSANLGGDITLKGPLLASPTLGGTINIATANITVPEKIPASLAAINLQHKNAPANVISQAKDLYGDEGKQSNGSSATNLDLAINAARRIFVRGRGMDAELGGSIRVRGTTALPIVSGGFKMIRGRLSILGRRLDFSSGTIGFSGGMVPNLDLKATTSASSLTITVGVSGPANDPQFTFTSSPSRPQDEVLAQLIFGRSASSLSPLQIAQLADAVLQLAGGQSTSLFSKLRSSTGLDNLDVTTDSKGGAQVTAGKYLNKRTYLELQQGSTSGTGKAIINLDAGRGLKLRGEANSDGSGSAGIFYEKQY